jgi:hypothetical protein
MRDENDDGNAIEGMIYGGIISGVLWLLIYYLI